MTILGNLWIFFLYYVCGRLSGLNSPFPKEAAGWFFFGTVGAIAICCVQLFFSMITNKGMGLCYPYSLYSVGMRANNPNLELHASTHLINSLTYIFLFTALSIFWLRKHEISAN